MSLSKTIALAITVFDLTVSSTFVVGTLFAKAPDKDVQVKSYAINPTVQRENMNSPSKPSSPVFQESPPQVAGAQTEMKQESQLSSPTPIPSVTSAFNTLLSPTVTPSFIPVESSANGGQTPTVTTTPTPTNIPSITATPTQIASVTQTPTFIQSSQLSSTPTVTETPSGFGKLLSPTAIATQTPTPTAVISESSSNPVLVSSQTVKLALSVSTMNQSKDRLRAPRSSDEIVKMVAKVKNLGSTHIGIETPYDSVPGTDSLAYTKEWISEARNANLKIWHRHMPINFEGIYDQPQINTPNVYTEQIVKYIKDNKDLFQAGDIFTPIPEPQNSGVGGMNSCPKGCMFKDVTEFNQWLVDVVTKSRAAFNEIGLGDQVKVVCCGFDGFMTWGDNNPDWQGKSFLYPETIAALGSISIDHYPTGGDTMAKDLSEFRAKWPNVDLWISETGSIPESGGGLNIEGVTKMILDGIRANIDIIKGFQWFQLGPASSEALVSDDGKGDFSPNEQFDEVQEFYKSQ